MKKQAKIVLALIALVAVIALLLGLYFVTRPDTQEGSKTFTLEVVHGDGTVKEFEYKTDEEYVGTVLIEDGLLKGEDGEWGLYIHEVDGERAVYEEDGAYWALFVGEEYAVQGIELTPIEDGSLYKLVYTIG